MFIELLSQCSCSHQCTPHYSQPFETCICRSPTLLCDGISILQNCQEVLDGFAFFKVYLYPKVVAHVFDIFTESLLYMALPCVYAVILWLFWVFFLLVLFKGFIWIILLIFIFLSGQVGYLHLCNTSLGWCSPF